MKDKVVMNAAYGHIGGSLRALIQQMVFAQDSGVPLAETLRKEGIDSILIDSLAVACDNERLRMRHSGIPVYARNSNEPLILGLAERPFKQPHQCLQHEAQFGVVDGVDVAACRFCGVPMPLNPEPENS